ncbi:integrase [Streptomyces sp. NPDC000878]
MTSMPMHGAAGTGRRTLRALREFETFDNEHRPHQGLANARPLHSLPAPIEDPDRIAHLDIRR